MKIFDFEMGPFFQIVNLIEDENEFAQYPIIETGIINDTIEDVFDNVIVVKNLDVIENKNVEVAAVPLFEVVVGEFKAPEGFLGAETFKPENDNNLKKKSI